MGVWHDPVLVQRDHALLHDAPFCFRPVVDLRPKGLGAAFTAFHARATGRVARERYRRLATFSPALLGYGARAMLAAALHQHADLTIVHSEAGLWVGTKLLRAGFNVGVDFEDWFSEDLLPEDRIARPLNQLKTFERDLVRNCRYCLTTSRAMAGALAAAYDGPEPAVIYNAFPRAERNSIDGQCRDRDDDAIPSIHWFSQTIGAGRGLEVLFEALASIIRPVQVHLRGQLTGRGRAWLDASLPREQAYRISIHPTVPNGELLSRISEHDIGLALEIPYCANKDLTVSNKLFQYLQAGLAIVATDTAGQREVMAQCPAAGLLVPANNAQALARALNSFLENPEVLRRAKAASMRAGESFSWEQQEGRLTSLAADALAMRIHGSQ